MDNATDAFLSAGNVPFEAFRKPFSVAELRIEYFRRDSGVGKLLVRER